MKILLPKLFVVIACIVCVNPFVASEAHAQNLVSNGDFSFNPIGTQVAIGAGGGIDTTTITDWRVYSVGGAPGFTATVIDNGSGGNALRLDVNNSNSAGGFALDDDAVRIPVTYGTSYQLTFQAAYIGGDNGLQVGLDQFSSSGNYVGNLTTDTYSLTSASYQNYTVDFTPLSPSATDLTLSFIPQTSGIEAISLENIEVQAVPEPGAISLLVLGIGCVGLPRVLRRKKDLLPV